jgi:hypothetical protein
MDSVTPPFIGNAECIVVVPFKSSGAARLDLVRVFRKVQTSLIER